MKDARDHDLGMDRAITRRDFLNGVAIGIGGLALGSTLTGCGRLRRFGFEPRAGSRRLQSAGGNRDARR